jgi:hypothetical protein
MTSRDFEDFRSREASLDGWLRRRARANPLSGASRIYVVCQDEREAGYDALASGAVTVENAPWPVQAKYAQFQFR